MARKSRKNKAPVAENTARFWRAALYVRLSVEFNSNRGDSLETQRQIMEAYLALYPDIEIVEVYTDNGVSGRTFERPGFQQMLEDIEQGKINCVVVKDLSRLGRNAIDSGYYLEKYFPLHHVRFISVNDQYDSEDNSTSAAHMIVPLKNMVNEAYAADISRKVRSQQRQAMQEGQFVGSRPPYGYLKDPQDCHKLVVNQDTAPVVRQIFQWAASGIAVNEIVKRLARDGVLTPGKYAESIGLLSHPSLIGSGRWDSRIVERILANEVYIGCMVQGKSKAVGHIQVRTMPDEWTSVRNTHEPLITDELFERAQAARKRNAEKFTRPTQTPYSPNILKGRIFCGHCGKNLHRQKNVNFYFYHCITNHRLGKGSCSGNVTSLHEDVLFHAIIEIICNKANAVIGNNLRLQTRDQAIIAKSKAADQEIAALQKEAAQAKRFIAGLYENLVSGLLTQDEYLELKTGYEKKVEDSLNSIQCLKARQSTLERQAKEYASLADMLAKVKADTKLTARLVDVLIERVTVNSSEDISIDFRFESGFDELMEVLGDE